MSARTLTCCVEVMTADVQGTLKDMCQSTCFFSITLDESADIKDMAQLAVVFRGSRDDFIIFEVPLLVPTCARQSEWLKEADLNLACMCSITTDGAVTMVRDKKDFVDVKCFHYLMH